MNRQTLRRIARCKLVLLVLCAFAFAPLLVACSSSAAQNQQSNDDANKPAAPRKAAQKSTAATVQMIRTPHGGIQPQAAVDAKGILHLIYYKGDPFHGNVYYVFSKDVGKSFSAPLRVNSQPDSAVAAGNIRGAQLALGKNGRVHVAWMGSQKANPSAPGDQAPMLYTRLNDAGTAFEPQRNIIQKAVGLDGGGSVAADGKGDVYVAWHAPSVGEKGFENRQLWVAKSTDEGKTFAMEQVANPEPTGACPCCGMRAFASSKGNLYILYRAAREGIHRDSMLLSSKGENKFLVNKLDPWELNKCPMTTGTFAEMPEKILVAWQTKNQVSFCQVNPKTGEKSPPISPPGKPNNRKYPSIAANSQGMILLAWTEGMSWNRGGSVHWQVFDSTGKSTQQHGRANGVPAWSLVGAVAMPDGRFVVIY